ncbi:MAG: hypothetical protein ACRYFU_23675 [Janthinobacterium lividum]
MAKHMMLTLFGMAILLGGFTTAKAQHRHCHYNNHHHRICK